MKKSVLVFTLLLLATLSYAQDDTKKKKLYGVFETKTLFQIGMLKDSAGGSMQSILRFAPFANYTLQLHYDVSNKFGIYTGVGSKNLGFITRYNSIGETVKSRAYCLSIPVGLKYGNMKEETYVYIAGEFLAQFDYKEKVFDGSTKTKRKNMNSDINSINWSTIVGLNYKGFTIGAEYTLGNFFSDSYKFQPSNNSPAYPTPSKSNILSFFLGFRTSLSSEDTNNDVTKKAIQQASLNRY
ncbi:MAG: outer membrane beta-barrel protein [Cytophagales bacterium]|nr:outer membrane beta-barrel protein [Cytophaga sp.]